VDKIFVINNDQLETYTTDGYSKALTELIKQEKPSLVLLAHDAVGRTWPQQWLKSWEQGRYQMLLESNLMNRFAV